MKRIVAMMTALALLLGCGAALAEETYETPLTELTERYGFRLGTCLSYEQLRNQKYLDLVKAQFSSLTMTNEMKAYSLLDERGSKRSADGMPVMYYQKADQMVKWCQENGIGVRGHTLVWDAYMCDWYFHEDYDTKKPYADKETIRARTKYYITEVINHFENKFPGVVYCWDVVNEAVGDNAGEYVSGDPRHLRTVRGGGVNLFREYMGDDYVSWAFLYARNAVEALGAKIDLYYNDYNAYFGDKAAAILALAAEVNSFAQDAEGNDRRLMDGIGMQGYIGGYGTQSGCLVDSHLNMIRDAILGYRKAGLKAQITEMAVRNFDQNQAEKHAKYYAKLFRIFKSLYDEETGENPLNVVAIWGISDNPTAAKGSYVYNLNSPWGGLVDARLEYKDAFRLVYEAMKE